jgi:hypothetical protein
VSSWSAKRQGELLSVYLAAELSELKSISHFDMHPTDPASKTHAGDARIFQMLNFVVCIPVTVSTVGAHPLLTLNTAVHFPPPTAPRNHRKLGKPTEVAGFRHAAHVQLPPTLHWHCVGVISVPLYFAQGEREAAAAAATDSGGAGGRTAGRRTAGGCGGGRGGSGGSDEDGSAVAKWRHLTEVMLELTSDLIVEKAATLIHLVLGPNTYFLAVKTEDAPPQPAADDAFWNLFDLTEEVNNRTH